MELLCFKWFCQHFVIHLIVYVAFNCLAIVAHEKAFYLLLQILGCLFSSMQLKGTSLLGLVSFHLSSSAFHWFLDI